ncbi:MAG TPA: glycosyltransferase family 39 protein [Acidimicrobiia bacterium]|nr:glycosyltransferase family 39 protein [Acidimicrobiia bacterium]
MPSTARRFYRWLIFIALAALAIRLGYAYWWKWDQKIWGDAYYYHYQANGLIHGRGFIIYFPRPHNVVLSGPASADHPPLAPLYYAAWSLLGLSSFHWHMIAGCVLGAGTVFVCGLVGREIAGERVGLIAAGIAAVYANLWVHDPLVTSETITMFMVAVVVLFSYRFWKQPSLRRALWFGAVCGLTALTRAEVVLFIPIVLLPFVLRVREWDMKKRLTTVVAAGLLAGVVMAPWVIRNMTAFKYPLYLSGGAEVTMVSANCDVTYTGPTLGWWSPICMQDPHAPILRDAEGNPVLDSLGHAQHGPYQPPGDASEQARYYRKIARKYIGDHLGRLPVVELARLGRVFDLYHPGSPFGTNGGGQTVSFDVIEGREPFAARLALAQYFVLMPMAIAGAVLLYRRRVTILPMLALLTIVVAAVLLAFGNTRYRTPMEIAIVALSAVTIDAVIGRIRGESSGEPEHVEIPDPVGPDAGVDHESSDAMSSTTSDESEEPAGAGV